MSSGVSLGRLKAAIQAANDAGDAWRESIDGSRPGLWQEWDDACEARDKLLRNHADALIAIAEAAKILVLRAALDANAEERRILTRDLQHLVDVLARLEDA